MSKRNIETEIVADSINPDGKRITTMLWTYPRFIHSEIMTHRALSRNAASSRAIPVSKVIEAVEENPARPEWWGKTKRGMQAGEEMEGAELERCWDIWKQALHLSIGGDHVVIPREKYEEIKDNILSDNPDDAIELFGDLDVDAKVVSGVRGLCDAGLHKQIANRVLEPWFRITVLVTATEWENFFSLRAHKDAQPEFQVLAYRALNDILKSQPTELEWGDWHIPFDSPDMMMLNDRLVVSVAKSARTSYVAFDADKTLQEQRDLFHSMKASGHHSPFEHQAQADAKVDTSGNFRGGWRQYRTMLAGENRSANLEELMTNKPDWIEL